MSRWPARSWCAVNTRLSAEEVRYICDHSGAKLLVVDTEYLPALAPVLETLQTVVEVVAVTDPLGPAPPDAADHAHHLLRRADEARLGRAAAVDGRGRDEPHLDQLHLGDDRHAQGRDVRASRRVPERAGRDHPPAVRPRERLPVDAADVPLQRLVHAVGGDRDRRDARVPARGARRRDLAAARRGARDPPRRRPDRPDDDRRRARRPTGSTASWSRPWPAPRPVPR